MQASETKTTIPKPQESPSSEGALKAQEMAVLNVEHDNRPGAPSVEGSADIGLYWEVNILIIIPLFIVFESLPMNLLYR
jgi:hypothetical protein